MTDTLRKLGLLIGSVLLSVLLVEGILRLRTDPHFLEGEPVDGFEWMKLDPVIGWKNCNRHWGEDYDKQERMEWTRANVNSLGFRGPELSPDKPSGQKRIVLIGDSGTFGVMNVGKIDAWHYMPIESYPERLSQTLRRTGTKNAEVINAGVVGYSASHGLRQFVTQILPLDPDVLIVRFGANDVEPSWAPERLSFEPRSRAVRWLLYRFHDWRLGRLALGYYQSLPIHPKPESRRLKPYKDFRLSMERIIEVARDQGVQVMLMDYQVSPAKRCNNLSRQLSQINVIVHELARTHQLPIVDSKLAFANSTDPVFAESDCVHPNPDAARI
ncbi:MAG TPA: SGNH/GDSL hydrolase family protein, partial [Myxococcales bacterium]|nr:SGNH/GDSL hydrolase family protein [Myxococcales bacterium]